MKLKKDDTVLIISGKDRGRKGKILKSLPKDGKILVEGINLRKKHQRPKKAGQKGQIIELPGFIPASSVKLICSKCGKPARAGFRLEGVKKYRICKKCNQEI